MQPVAKDSGHRQVVNQSMLSPDDSDIGAPNGVHTPHNNEMKDHQSPEVVRLEDIAAAVEAVQKQDDTERPHNSTQNLLAELGEKQEHIELREETSPREAPEAAPQAASPAKNGETA